MESRVVLADRRRRRRSPARAAGPARRDDDAARGRRCGRCSAFGRRGPRGAPPGSRRPRGAPRERARLLPGPSCPQPAALRRRVPAGAAFGPTPGRRRAVRGDRADPRPVGGALPGDADGPVGPRRPGERCVLLGRGPPRLRGGGAALRGVGGLPGRAGNLDGEAAPGTGVEPGQPSLAESLGSMPPWTARSYSWVPRSCRSARRATSAWRPGS